MSGNLEDRADPALTKSQLQRLQFARLMLHQATDYARIDHTARNAACVTALQDAVEMLLLIVSEKVDAQISDKSNFNDYLDKIDKAIQPKQLPLRSTMLRMNRIRVGAKHHGIFPSHEEAASLVHVVKAWMEGVCETHLGRSLSAADLSSLVRDGAKRALFEEAEQALAGRAYAPALSSARKAFYLAFEEPYDVSRFASGTSPLGLLGALGCEAPSFAQSSNYIERSVGDPFGYIVFDHPGIEAKLIKQGSDPVMFWNVWRLTPAVFQMADGTWLVKKELEKFDSANLESDAFYVVSSVTEMILRQEDQVSRSKLRQRSGQWILTVKAGATMHHKADASSQVLHKFDGGESIRVDAATYGFSGEPGWWQVFHTAGGYLTGFLHEEDVDRSDEPPEA